MASKDIKLLLALIVVILLGLLVAGSIFIFVIWKQNEKIEKMPIWKNISVVDYGINDVYIGSKECQGFYFYNPALIFVSPERPIVLLRTAAHIDSKFINAAKKVALSRKESLALTEFVKHHRLKCGDSFLVSLINKNLFPLSHPLPFDSIPNAGYEDPRLFWFRERVWVICHFRFLDTRSKISGKMVIWPLDQPQENCILKCNSMKQCEKNWMPFEVDGELYVTYTLYPTHRVLHVDTTTGFCRDIASTHVRFDFIYNDVGGGAPPVRLNQHLFLGLGHTRSWHLKFGPLNIVRKNFFYLMEATHPYKIIMVTKEHHFWKTWRDQSVSIEFVSALTRDPEDPNKMIVGMGINDLTFKFIKIDLQQILDQMMPVLNR